MNARAKAATPTTRVVPGVVDVVVLSAASKRAREPWRVLVLKRGANTRCPGAWELVHGRIERKERPADAALREVHEETGLIALRLYNVTVNAFYLHQSDTVQLGIVFAAIVDEPGEVALGDEHVESAWLTPLQAMRRVAWPREREAIEHVRHLLRSGDAGAVEDVLRVR